MYECELAGFMNGHKFRKLCESKYNIITEKYNLRNIELDVLFFLYQNRCCCTAKEIVNKKCLSKAHISKAIENLNNMEYVVTTRGCADRRYTHLALTDKSEPVIKDIENAWKEIYVILFNNIDEEEKSVLRQLITKMQKNMDTALEI